MVVQHNLTSMNANRQLGVTTSAQAKSTEKLSSGYRINRAGDDAAGLTISEKMRSQIRGLDQASTNAQDGISLIQAAEGALSEAHSILQRMNELAVQGANDTNEYIDRDAINEELNALTEELDRISTTTQFNKQNLLDGTFTSRNLQVGANENQKIAISIDNMNAKSLGLKGIVASEMQSDSKIKEVNYNGMTYTYSAAITHALNVESAIGQMQSTLSITMDSATYGVQLDTETTSAYYIDKSGNRYELASQAMGADLTSAKAIVSTALGENFFDYAKIDQVTKSSPTVAIIEVGQANVDNYTNANATITAVQDAINKVSSQRSALGALQNRLEHTVANLDTISENTSAAESRIRDLDMANEMVEYSKNNILAQAGQSMLAQANQATQGVLSLLG